MKKYKTFEELKKELGDKFEEYMYKSNIELLNKIDKAIEYIEEIMPSLRLSNQMYSYIKKHLLDILKGEE